HRPEYEGRVAGFTRRMPFAFDHFERYYGAFFSLLDAGERLLYLDAETWQDGVSTMLKDAAGAPLLIHCWYTRHWDTSYHTRQRYRTVIAYARQAQGLGPLPAAATAPDRPAGPPRRHQPWEVGAPLPERPEAAALRRPAHLRESGPLPGGAEGGRGLGLRLGLVPAVFTSRRRLQGDRRLPVSWRR